MISTNCKICSNPVNKFIDKKTKKVYLNCPKCGLIFLHKDFYVTEEEEKDRYDQHNNTPDNEGYVTMFNSFIEECITPFKKSGKVLDFGCGPHPVLASILDKRGYSCKFYDKYFYHNTDFNQEKYDIIILSEVIEHLSSPMQILLKLRNLLKKDGIITIMTLFHNENIEEFQKWWYKSDITHISFFSEKTFTFINNTLGMKTLYSNKKNRIVLKKKENGDYND